MADQQETQTLSQENLVTLNKEQLQNINGGSNPFSCCFKPATTERAITKADKSIHAARSATIKADNHVHAALEKATAKLERARQVHADATALRSWVHRPPTPTVATGN